jgi:hypothetical protein
MTIPIEIASMSDLDLWELRLKGGDDEVFTQAIVLRTFSRRYC